MILSVFLAFAIVFVPAGKNALAGNIVAIEYNLQWNGVENTPGYVRILDDTGAEVEVIESWEKIDGIYYWDVSLAATSTEEVFFINFWETK